MPILATVFAAAAGIGFLLALVQVLIWFRLRASLAPLFGAVMSAGASAIALVEASYLRAQTLEAYQVGLEVGNVAIAVTLVAMVWFVKTRLDTGRLWLLWAITTSWTICAIISLASDGNLTFVSLNSISYPQTPWGESFTSVTGTPHPFRILADLTTILIVAFVADATFSAIRFGKAKLAVRVGLPVLFFIMVAGIHTPLVDVGLIKTPFMISLFFGAIALSLAIGLVNDVAISAKLTDSLATERQRWKSVLDGVELAVVHIDIDGRIAYVNPYLLRMLGRDIQDLTGKKPVELAPSSEHTEIEAVLENADTWTTRSRIRRPLLSSKGEIRELLWFSVSLRDEDGKPDGVIAFGQDITDQLAAEDARDKKEREIEKLSRALTMGEFASTFAHELSQPIAAVLSNAQTLKILNERDGVHSESTNEIVADILRDTRRARDLMKRVREFMFNEEPKQSEFDLGAMIMDCLEMLSLEAREQGTRFITTGDDYLVMVHAARLELQQVVLNLALNALQAVSTVKGGRVLVDWCAVSDTTVKIILEDNGPSMSDAQMKAIFQPFVSFKSGGTGIGLAVVRRIVERHHGEITVETGELKGARFVLTLPIAITTEGQRYG